MIEFTKSYKTHDGQVFGTLKEAQAQEIGRILASVGATASVVDLILDKKDEIVDVLTMTTNSKPKARSINGGTKKRTKKAVITDANTDANQTPTTADLTALAH